MYLRIFKKIFILNKLIFYLLFCYILTYIFMLCLPVINYYTKIINVEHLFHK